jgi:hypothetical protein
MLHYYLQKGITPEQILSRNYAEKLFYYASMSKALEEGSRAVDETAR